MAAMIAVFVAMDSELAGLARRLTAREHETLGGRRVVRGRCGARCQRRAMETLGLFLKAFAGALPALPVAGARRA